MTHNFGNYQGAGPHFGCIVEGGIVRFFDLPGDQADKLTVDHNRYRLNPMNVFGSDGLSRVTSAVNNAIGYRASLPLVSSVPYVSTAVSRGQLIDSKVMLIHNGDTRFLEPRTDTPGILQEVPYVDITEIAETAANLENANLKEDLNDVLRLSKDAFNHAKHEYQTALGEYRRVQQTSSSFARKKAGLLRNIAKAHSHLCLTKTALEHTLSIRYDDEKPKYVETFDERECESAREALYSTEIENIHLRHMGSKIGTENRLRDTVLFAKDAWKKFNETYAEIQTGALQYATAEEQENLLFALVVDVEKAFDRDPTLKTQVEKTPAYKTFETVSGRVGQLNDADFRAALRNYFYDKKTRELPDSFTRRLSPKHKAFAQAVMAAKNKQLNRQDILDTFGRGLIGIAEFFHFTPSMRRTVNQRSQADALNSLARNRHPLSLMNAVRRTAEVYRKQFLSDVDTFDGEDGNGSIDWAKNSAKTHCANIYNILHDINLMPLLAELKSAISAIQRDNPTQANLTRIQRAKEKIDNFLVQHGTYTTDFNDAFAELERLSTIEAYTEKTMGMVESEVMARYNEAKKLKDSYDSIMNFADLILAEDPTTLLAEKRTRLDKEAFPQTATLLGKFMVCKTNMLAADIDSKAELIKTGGFAGIGATTNWYFSKEEFLEIETYLSQFRVGGTRLTPALPLPTNFVEVDAMTEAPLGRLTALRNAYDPFANKMINGEHRDRYVAFNDSLQRVEGEIADLKTRILQVFENLVADAHGDATAVTSPATLRKATTSLEAAVDHLQELSDKYPGRAAQLAAQIAQDASTVGDLVYRIITTQAGLAANAKAGLARQAEKLEQVANQAAQIAAHAATKTAAAETPALEAAAAARNASNNALAVQTAAV